MFARLSAPLRDLIQPPAGQNPSLDVLRTCAILMVIAGHTLTPMASEQMSAGLYSRLPFVRAGWTGVDLFFALSGYLIGRQLWRELQRTNRIGIGRFMVRRGLRIWPLYFAALVLTVLVVEPGKYSVSDWLPDLLFVANYTGPQVIHGGWSLCIEEQFYLLAPLALLLSFSRLRTLEAYRPYLIGLLVFLPVLRGLIWWQLTADNPAPEKSTIDKLFYFPIHTHADGLVIGMLIANLEATGAFKKGGSIGRVWTVALAWIVGGLLFFANARLFNYTALALIFGSVICFCLARGDAMPSIVRARPFYILSRLSYGMYLNHQWLTWPVFALLRQVPGLSAQPALFGVAFFVTLALASALLATVTYSVIEFPFLRLREHLLHKKPPESPPPLPPVDAAPSEAPAGFSEPHARGDAVSGPVS